MNYEKKLILTLEKSKIQWGTIFVFFSMVLVFTACEEDNGRDYPSLEVVNQSYYTITSVTLVGYEFKSLRILAGNSQTFILDKGMSGGYSDINITVSYGNPGLTTPMFSSRKVDFKKGKTTTITLSGRNLEYNP